MAMFLKRLLLLLKRKGAKSDDGFLLPSEVQALKMSYAEIQHATNNFSSDLVIYCDQFGDPVYEGTLCNGVRVAVKRRDPKASTSNTNNFLKEFEVLFQTLHPRIVSLVGYCFEFGEAIIVYENMGRLSRLKDQLYVKEKIGYAYARRSRLSWEQRLQICIDTAEALQYLHTGTDLAGRVIHRDVKSATILVDENYRAKLSEFGLAISDPLRREAISSNTVAGTHGYLDPEYAMTGRVTEKSDVYAFGVVLLEVLSARSPSRSGLKGEEVDLPAWGILCRKKGELENIIDPVLWGNINFSCLKIFFDTAEKCLSMSSEKRPTMREVLQNLELALEFQLEQNGCSSP